MNRETLSIDSVFGRGASQNAFSAEGAIQSLSGARHKLQALQRDLGRSDNRGPDPQRAINEIDRDLVNALDGLNRYLSGIEADARGAADAAGRCSSLAAGAMR